MKTWLQTYPVLLPALWLVAVPWLLFPAVAPGLTAAGLVLLLLILINPRRYIPGSILPGSPINSYLLVFLLLTGVAYVVSPLPQVSLPKLTVTILGAITFFLLFPRLNKPERVERLVTILAVCSGPVALAGFFTLEWPERQIINLQPITDLLPHLSGSFSVNFNEMAGTLLMIFPFVLAAFRKQEGRFKKTFFSLNLLLLISLLFFTQSRGAFLGLLVIGLTWWGWGRLSLRKIMPVFIIFSLGLLLIILLIGLSPADVFDWLSTLDAGSKQGDAPPNSWLSRIEIWQVAGGMLADYPVIGSGLYTFDPVSRANYYYETILPSFNPTHAHNLFLQAGASLGIGGLLALIGIWGTTLLRLWQTGCSNDGRIQRLSAVFAASTVGYLFFNLFDTITFGQKPGLFTWIILAGSIGLSQLAREQSTPIVQPSLITRGRSVVGNLISFAPLLMLIILLLSPALPRNLANLKLDQARFQTQSALMVTEADFPDDVRRAGLVHHLSGDVYQALSYWQLDPQGAAYLRSQGTVALMGGQSEEAIGWYNLSLVLAPDSAETHLWRGMANENQGAAALAEADYQKAAEYTAVSDLDNTTKAFIFYRLGNVLTENEAWPDAAEAFEKAVTFDPESAYYYRRLGDVLVNLGDADGARAAYQKAEQIE